MVGHTGYQYPITIHDAHRWTANLRIIEIDEIKTVPHVPLSHPCA